MYAYYATCDARGLTEPLALHLKTFFYIKDVPHMILFETAEVIEERDLPSDN